MNTPIISIMCIFFSFVGFMTGCILTQNKYKKLLNERWDVAEEYKTKITELLELLEKQAAELKFMRVQVENFFYRLKR